MLTLRFSSPRLSSTATVTLRFASNFSGTTLRFNQTWNNSVSPVVLRFGDEAIPPQPEVPIAMGRIGITLTSAIAKAPSREQYVHLVNYSRKLTKCTKQTWQNEATLDCQQALSWRSIKALSYRTYIYYVCMATLETQSEVSWQLPSSFTTALTAQWLCSQVQPLSMSLSWLEPLATNTMYLFNHQNPTYSDTQITLESSYWQQRGKEEALRWGIHKPRWICSTQYLPPQGLVSLRFTERHAVAPVILRFKPANKYCYFDDGGGLIDAHPIVPTIDRTIPIEPQIQRSYRMQPQVTCIRLRDEKPIVLSAVSISYSRSQWASNGSLSFSSKIDAQLAIDELLKITVNGYEFYLWCEQLTKTKRFGVSQYTATGRGRLAELAAPYIKPTNRINTHERSFIGVMGDIVENTGWSISSNITDYSIPAEAFSCTNKTPAEALHLMTAAVGAMLDIDGETQTINVIPQWPTQPWNTTDIAPAVVLHDAVILAFSEQREIRPTANAVFVRGEQQGVSARVKRHGSAGDDFAADVVDKLITDIQAARMRGTFELANAGNKIKTTIRTKVMVDLPPIRPGMLIGVSQGGDVFKANCDASSISASVDANTGQVSVNQSITLLRNEAEA